MARTSCVIKIGNECKLIRVFQFSRNGTTFSTLLIKYEGHVLLCFNYQAVNTAESKIASLEKKKRKILRCSYSEINLPGPEDSTTEKQLSLKVWIWQCCLNTLYGNYQVLNRKFYFLPANSAPHFFLEFVFLFFSSFFSRPVRNHHTFLFAYSIIPSVNHMK